MNSREPQPTRTEVMASLTEGDFRKGFLGLLRRAGNQAAIVIEEEMGGQLEATFEPTAIRPIEFYVHLALAAARFVKEKGDAATDRLKLACELAERAASAMISLEDPQSLRRGNPTQVMWERLAMAMGLGEASAVLYTVDGLSENSRLERSSTGATRGLELLDDSATSAGTRGFRETLDKRNAAQSWWHQAFFEEWERRTTVGLGGATMNQVYDNIAATVLRPLAKTRGIDSKNIPKDWRGAMKKARYDRRKARLLRSES